jgi:hypothetical protein
MLGLTSIIKKAGGLAKKGVQQGAKNVAAGKGLMGNKETPLSSFLEGRKKKKEAAAAKSSFEPKKFGVQ